MVISVVVTTVVVILVLARSKHRHYVSMFDMFAQEHFVPDGAVVRKNANVAGGLVSIIFAASLLNFVVYALTSYIKDNVVVTKVPTTINIPLQHPDLAYFDFEGSIVMRGSFGVSSSTVSSVSGVVQRDSPAPPVAEVVQASATVRELRWQCSACRFDGSTINVDTTLASKHEFIHSIRWTLSANSFALDSRTSAIGYAEAPSGKIISRRLAGEHSLCGAPKTTDPTLPGITVRTKVRKAHAFPYFHAAAAALTQCIVTTTRAQLVPLQAVAVHYFEEARPSVYRSKKERVGLELSFDANVLSGATCEAEYWAQSHISGDGRGALVRLQVELLPQSWEVTAKQKNSAFGLAVEVSAMIGGIHLVFFGILQVMEHYKKAAKKIHLACIRKCCRNDQLPELRGDDLSDSDDDIEAGGDTSLLLPPMKKIDKATDRILRLERTQRMLVLAQRTLYVGGKAKSATLDIVAQLWSIPEVIVRGCTMEDAYAVRRFTGSFKRSESSVGGAYPTWFQDRLDGSAPLAIFFSHRRWKMGVLGHSASLRSAEKSRNLETSTSPLELTWEVRVGHAWLPHETLVVALPPPKLKQTLATIFKKKKKKSSLRPAVGVRVGSKHGYKHGMNNPMLRPGEGRAHGAGDESSGSWSSDSWSSGSSSGSRSSSSSDDGSDTEKLTLPAHVKGRQAAANSMVSLVDEASATGDDDAVVKSVTEVTESHFSHGGDMSHAHQDVLPEGWSAVTSSSGVTYYVNATTGAKQWALPSLPGGEAAMLPEGWSAAASSDGATYYVNATTGVTQWSLPSQ